MVHIDSPAAPLRADLPELFSLCAAQVGMRCLIHSLGDTLEHRLELLAAGLAPDQEIDVLSVSQKRHCVVACGQIRAAIGADLAQCITLKACEACQGTSS
ncbi:MAG: ferrous iron transport protein A [Pseudopelagicola sp.]|nr:ferrous iron transport protein A [Pseudopelagicola sp.]